MNFSERMGLVPVRQALQVNEMDDALRTKLWNVLEVFVWRFARHLPYDVWDGSELAPFVQAVQMFYFHDRLDSLDDRMAATLRRVDEHFFGAAWNVVYDFIEFIVANQEYLLKSDWSGMKLVDVLNETLASHMSGYRFVGDKLVPITNEHELAELEAAQRLSAPYAGARLHIETAVAHLSDRTNPDYRNAIKEAISAVESVCNVINGTTNATLGGALKTLEQRGIVPHKALQEGFSKLYGWTSQADGIRHGLLDEPTLDQADARFMVVACSAFVNYLVEKARQAGLPAARAE